MLWIQRQLRLAPFRRGFHLITKVVVEAVPELGQVELGLLHVFLPHTSAALTFNENADPDVRRDLEMALSTIAPEDWPYSHTLEGPDDMPAHVKSSLLGADLTVPVAHGKLCLGTWQGIYLCEHRERGGHRRLIVTLMGQSRRDRSESD
jgi:secondary thiamine-phosphate synthase enzyme